jgi:hypothetical protein
LTLVRTTPTIAALAFGITLHPEGGTVQQHAVMRLAKDFDHTVRADTINHQVARPADAVLRGDEITAEPKRINTGTSDFPSRVEPGTLPRPRTRRA